MTVNFSVRIHRRRAEKTTFGLTQTSVLPDTGASLTLCRLSTTGYLSFGPMAQCVVHALKGLARRARVTPASSPVLHARGCASPSCARSPRCCHRKHNLFSMGPKLRYPTEACPTGGWHMAHTKVHTHAYVRTAEPHTTREIGLSAPLTRKQNMAVIKTCVANKNAE